LFVFCSSFVRLSFVFPLSACAARTICLCGSHYLPMWLALSARVARTVINLVLLAFLALWY
ncbi:iron ABC transporter permease, partial [Capnocytophaga sp. oral taxon 380]|uniref:iron ABC transporter permease n=1 Tax=Capnocytophaga sp. oral taxon 380 TaxID=712217 RepID=UPI001E4FD203